MMETINCPFGEWCETCPAFLPLELAAPETVGRVLQMNEGMDGFTTC